VSALQFNRSLNEPDNNGNMKKDVIPIAAMLIMFLGPIITLWLVGAFAPLVDWLVARVTRTEGTVSSA
jgi:hypothetical protein